MSVCVISYGVSRGTYYKLQIQKYEVLSSTLCVQMMECAFDIVVVLALGAVQQWYQSLSFSRLCGVVLHCVV